jgi:hypothetical protein
MILSLTTAIPSVWFGTPHDSEFVHHMHVTATLHGRHLPLPVKRFRQSRTNQRWTGHGHAKARTLLNAPTATTIMKISVDILSTSAVAYRGSVVGL